MDGTLVNVMPAHKLGLNKSVLHTWGINGFPQNFQVGGRPQLQTLREVCRVQGIPESLIEERLPEAARLLSEITIAALPENIEEAILPGVFPLLDALVEREVHLVLVTGALQKTACTILERSDLGRYFPIQVYGEWGKTRQDLAREAIRRAVQKYQLELDTLYMAAVGDTPTDILTARALGIRVICVTTGLFNYDQLAPLLPDVILTNFADLQASLAALLGNK
jgi:phosphoglycolate phosphatase-like HAD superfamily hydrolase